MSKLPACPKCRYRLKQTDIGAIRCPKCDTNIAGRLAESAAANTTPAPAEKPTLASAKCEQFASDNLSYVDRFALFLGMPAVLRQRKRLILLAWGTLTMLAASSIFTNFDQVAVQTDHSLADIETYARAVSASSKPGVLIYKSTVQTHASPLTAFKVVYLTNHPSLKMEPLISKGSPQWQESSAVALAWKIKFCAKDLTSMMTKRGISSVEGHVVDGTSGEIHQLAVCNQLMAAESKLPAPGSMSRPELPHSAASAP